MRVKNREPCPDCHVGSMIAKCRTIMTWTPFSLEKLRNVSIKWRFTSINGRWIIQLLGTKFSGLISYNLFRFWEIIRYKLPSFLFIGPYYTLTLY